MDIGAITNTTLKVIGITTVRCQDGEEVPIEADLIPGAPKLREILLERAWQSSKRDGPQARRTAGSAGGQGTGKGAMMAFEVTNPAPVDLAVPVRGLQKAIEFLRYHRDSVGLSDKEKRRWDEDFVKLDSPELCELASAAFHLGVSPLVDLTCKAIAKMMQGRSPEEIRQVFHIENDFTPEEEAALPRGYYVARGRIRQIRRKSRNKTVPRDANPPPGATLQHVEAARPPFATDDLTAGRCDDSLQLDIAALSVDELVDFIEHTGGPQPNPSGGKKKSANKTSATSPTQQQQQPFPTQPQAVATSIEAEMRRLNATPMADGSGYTLPTGLTVRFIEGPAIDEPTDHHDPPKAPPDKPQKKTRRGKKKGGGGGQQQGQGEQIKKSESSSTMPATPPTQTHTPPLTDERLHDHININHSHSHNETDERSPNAYTAGGGSCGSSANRSTDDNSSNGGSGELAHESGDERDHHDHHDHHVDHGDHGEPGDEGEGEGEGESEDEEVEAFRRKLLEVEAHAPTQRKRVVLSPHVSESLRKMRTAAPPP